MLLYCALVAILQFNKFVVVSSLPLSVDSNVHVIVYGLDGDGGVDECQLAVDTDHLARMLETVLPSRRPHFVDTGTTEDVRLQFLS